MILAIETSCDDSAVAILDMDGKIISSEISSQIKFHEKFGGVVPEIASRKHLETLPLLIRSVFEEHSLTIHDFTAVAVTTAPGLIGSLLVGVSYAKTLAWMADIPVIPVDHLEGHLLAPFLDCPELKFPYLSLIASGGHTHLIVAKGIGDYQLLGKTLDDAAGEAFDKVAKMLGFKYPGGPIVDQIAQGYGSPDIPFPIPLKGKKGLNFSFSGLKTAVRNVALARGIYVEKKELLDLQQFEKDPDHEKKNKIRNVCASFQQTMNQIIYERIKKALDQTGLKRFAITGGVAANHGIRNRLSQFAQSRKLEFYFPSPRHCTDNAAMIAYAGLEHFKKNRNSFKLDLKLSPSSKSPLSLMEISEQ